MSSGLLSGTLYRVAVVITDVFENVSPPSSGFPRVIGFHSYITVESSFISLYIDGYSVRPKNSVLWDAFTAVSITDVFWGYVQ
jgi:hypothetical protein